MCGTAQTKYEDTTMQPMDVQSSSASKGRDNGWLSWRERKTRVVLVVLLVAALLLLLFGSQATQLLKQAVNTLSVSSSNCSAVQY